MHWCWGEKGTGKAPACRREEPGNSFLSLWSGDKEQSMQEEEWNHYYINGPKKYCLSNNSFYCWWKNCQRIRVERKTIQHNKTHTFPFLQWKIVFFHANGSSKRVLFKLRSRHVEASIRITPGKGQWNVWAMEKTDIIRYFCSQCRLKARKRQVLFVRFSFIIFEFYDYIVHTPLSLSSNHCQPVTTLFSDLPPPLSPPLCPRKGSRSRLYRT